MSSFTPRATTVSTCGSTTRSPSGERPPARDAHASRDPHAGTPVCTKILVEYEQQGGAYNLRLEWAPRNGSPRPLPRHYLFPERADADDLQLVQRATWLRHFVAFLWMMLIVTGFLWVVVWSGARSGITATVVGSAPVVHAVPSRLSTMLVGAAYALAIWIFVKNAWVAEDAYIIFRSVEQVFAGNGPVWNSHERVQAFTSPLWFGLLVLSRAVFRRPVLEHRRALVRAVVVHAQKPSAPRAERLRVRHGCSVLHGVSRDRPLHEFRP